MTRCPTCDRPLATQADYDAHHDGCMCERCTSLCWRAWTADRCLGAPVDWRARALAAETRVAALETALGEALDALGVDGSGALRYRLDIAERLSSVLTPR